MEECLGYNKDYKSNKRFFDGNNFGLPVENRMDKDYIRKKGDFMKRIFSSLRSRIFFTFGFSFLCIMLFLLIVVQVFSNRYFSQMAVSSTRRELAASTDNLESTLSHIFDYSISVSINEKIIERAKENPHLPESETAQYELRKELNSVISTIIGLSPNIEMWDIMAIDGSYLKVGGYDLTYLNGFEPEMIFQLHENSIRAQIIGPFYYLPAREALKEQGKYLFIVSKPIVDLNTRDIYGYVLFFVEDSVLASPFINYRPEDSKVSFFIADENNQILLAAEDGYVGMQLGEAVPVLGEEENLNELEERQYLIEAENGQRNYKMVYCRTKMENPAWQLIHLIPLNELMEEQQIFERAFFGIMILMMCIFFFLAWWNAHTTTNPILKLSNIMKNVVKDAYVTAPVPKSTEEIRILYQGYNNLVLQTEELLQTIYEEQKEKNDYQFRLVQAQIKPHFLYNTLEMIKSMIDLEIYEEAGEAISSLALFYRHSLNQGSDIIMIGNEIEMMEQYLYIEKLRHMEYFDYKIQADVQARDYVIPKLTLQPILENAIVHGAASNGRVCFVNLTVETGKDIIHFSVKDDGMGINPEQLMQLRDALEHSQKAADKSFGLRSINRRIKLLFGSEYGIKIESTPGEGTEVTLDIPKVRKSEEEVSDIFDK